MSFPTSELPGGFIKGRVNLDGLSRGKPIARASISWCRRECDSEFSVEKAPPNEHAVKTNIAR